MASRAANGRRLGGYAMRIPNLSIYKELPDTVNLTSKDVIKAFGYKSTIHASCLCRQGYLPKPSKLQKPEKPNKRTHIFRKHSRLPANRVFWNLGELRELAKELEK